MAESSEKNLILNREQVQRIIERIAYQIYEENHKEEELVIAGIWDRGYVFGEFLADKLREITDKKIHLVKVSLDKGAKVQPEISVDAEEGFFRDKSVIVTDDVLNTGRALLFSVAPFLKFKVKKLQTAVIVDRDHKLFPVATNFVGYSLATTLKEHIHVEFSEKGFGVYLH